MSFSLIFSATDRILLGPLMSSSLLAINLLSALYPLSSPLSLFISDDFASSSLSLFPPGYPFSPLRHGHETTGGFRQKKSVEEAAENKNEGVRDGERKREKYGSTS